MSDHKTILILDDEAAIRRLSQRLLHRLTYQTLEAENGNQGFQLLSNPSTRIDSVLLDLNLPDGAGTEWAEKFRNLRPELPIVYFTGSNPPADQGNAREERNFFLKKPFTPASIQDVFQRVFASDA